MSPEPGPSRPPIAAAFRCALYDRGLQVEGEGMSVRDGRVERYAELLLDTCLGVERGWQVMVWSTPWARPLLEEVMKQLAERGAYPLLRLTFSGGHWREHRAWLRHAPLDVISEAAA